MCACPPDSKIKYSVFYDICVLMFMSSSNNIQDQCLIVTDIHGVRDYIIICSTLCVILLVSFVQSYGKFLCYS